MSAQAVFKRAEERADAKTQHREPHLSLGSHIYMHFPEKQQSVR